MEIGQYIKKKYLNSQKIIWIFIIEGGYPFQAITGNKCSKNIIDHPH